jgi:hypothetical protein
MLNQMHQGIADFFEELLGYIRISQLAINP